MATERQQKVFSLAYSGMRQWAWRFKNEMEREPETGIVFCVSFKDHERNVSFQKFLDGENVSNKHSGITMQYEGISGTVGVAKIDILRGLDDFYPGLGAYLEKPLPPGYIRAFVLDDDGMLLKLIPCNNPTLDN